MPPAHRTARGASAAYTARGAGGGCRSSRGRRAAISTFAGAKPKVSSLFDMNDIQFKMMMIKRLGKEDYNKIFGGIRVEREIL
jgi:hypothetical protein